MYGGVVSFPKREIAKIEIKRVDSFSKSKQTNNHTKQVRLSPARVLAGKAYKHASENPFSSQARQEALDLLNQAKEIDPNDAEVLLVEAIMILQDGYRIGVWYKASSFTYGFVESAMQKASAAIDSDPDYSKSYSILAWFYIIKSDYEKAEELLEKSYILDNQNFFYWFHRGTLRIEQQQYNEANEYFDIADKFATTDFLSNLVRSRKKDIAKLTGNKEETEHYYLDQIKRYPESPHAYGNYASFLLCNGRSVEAIDYYTKAISITPYPAAIKGLAIAELKNQLAVKCNGTKVQI